MNDLLCGRLRHTRKLDEGMTVIELLVAIAIFTVVTSIFMAAVVNMSRSTVRTQTVADAGNDLRRVFQQMDKEVRYASAVNLPGVGATSGTRYVEIRTTAVPLGQSPLCTQWRFVAADRTLQTRTWSDAAGAVPTHWTTLATRVRNDLTIASQEPFTMTEADGVHVRQLLSVVLLAGPVAGSAQGTGAEMKSVFVARNSSMVAGGHSVCPLTSGARP